MRGLKAALIALFALTGFVAAAQAADPENTIYLDLKDGRVVIELLPEIAPLHAQRIRELSREGFYNGVVFHRVIPGFMAQTGDPTGTGMGGSFKPDVKLEASNRVSFIRGTVGMARAANPNSANSQFFIVTEDSTFLDGNYTLFGRVIEGMEYVDMIAPGEPPANPDKIVKMQVAADAE